MAARLDMDLNLTLTQKVGQPSSSFNDMPTKIAKKLLWFVLNDEISLISQFFITALQVTWAICVCGVKAQSNVFNTELTQTDGNPALNHSTFQIYHLSCDMSHVKLSSPCSYSVRLSSRPVRSIDFDDIPRPRTGPSYHVTHLKRIDRGDDF